MVATKSALHRFAGVLVERIFGGERYVLAQAALDTSNRLLRFRLDDRGWPTCSSNRSLREPGNQAMRREE